MFVIGLRITGQAARLHIIMTPKENQVFLTCSEAGRECRPPVTGHRIRQMVDRGELRALKTPSGWRLIPLAEIQRLNETRVSMLSEQQ